MDRISKEELKIIQLSILGYVKKICDDNNIPFFLTYGTMLGAVRHKGYIPWDDDIDIAMLRKDYERFEQIFNKEDSKYKFVSIYNDAHYFLPFGKVIDTETVIYEPDETGNKTGVYIDVFPFDNAPEDHKSIQRINRRLLFLRRIADQRQPFWKPHGSWIRKSITVCLRFLLKIFPETYFNKLRDRIAQKYNKMETGFICDFSSRGLLHCNSKVFSDYIEVEFENEKYKIPIGYDECLKQWYGNYMELPPIEKQVSHHDFIAFKKI